MISELARKWTSKIYPEAESEEADLYAYGFFVLFSKVLCLTEVVLSGILLHNVCSAVLFYFVFTPLREYSGGIHARKEKTCLFCTTLALFFSVAVIRLLEASEGCAIQVVLHLIGISAIFLFSPLDNSANPITEEERLLFRKKSRHLCVAASSFSICFFMLGLRSLTNVISVALALEGVLLITGKARAFFFCEDK